MSRNLIGQVLGLRLDYIVKSSSAYFPPRLAGRCIVLDVGLLLLGAPLTRSRRIRLHALAVGCELYKPGAHGIHIKARPEGTDKTAGHAR